MCKDKPWLPENNETRVLSAPKTYTVKVTEMPLIINSLRLNLQSGENIEIFSNTEYASVTLDVSTSGGAVAGEPKCMWKFSRTASYNGPMDGGTISAPNSHRQVFGAVESGDYTIYVYCEDNIGNNVTNITSFRVTKDVEVPWLIRVYYDNQLKITTNENAECRYALNNITQDWEEKEARGLMGSSDHRIHTAPWFNKGIYYIQCEDDYDNLISMQDQIIVEAYDPDAR